MNYHPIIWVPNYNPPKRQPTSEQSMKKKVLQKILQIRNEELSWLQRMNWGTNSREMKIIDKIYKEIKNL